MRGTLVWWLAILALVLTCDGKAAWDTPYTPPSRRRLQYRVGKFFCRGVLLLFHIRDNHARHQPSRALCAGLPQQDYPNVAM